MRFKRRWLSWVMGKSSVSYPERVADQLGLKLERLAQHPKGLQLKQMVFQLRPKIEAAQAAGYSLDDVVALFRADDVAISVSTLKTYLREARAAVRAGAIADAGAGRSGAAIVEPNHAKSGKVRSGTKKQTAPQTAPPDLTNTNAAGFQEMRSDDDL
ncbi:hypothetical protein IQ266_12060 [filamentous cyanobacterium LEGE 11480]|uniref:Uncharacterized protein n=1 Tax=Romeriopsis navalis LEGE 11480 TaxID=2777977 RepID=A0A928VLE4_9CYAN|nr:hypothetical protein [Romeriopsis navalis]MBE9030465.1 hypothetical protein [Romeriopsis navalis LEGE 11480]